MVLAPATSALNPIIYAARIRRFKIRIKKLLNLTISHSDKYDTYEIRQSFKVKRTPAVAVCKTLVKPVTSLDDSGVGISNDDDEISPEPTDTFEHYQQNRSLSRISESPENQSQLGSTARLQNLYTEHPQLDERRASNKLWTNQQMEMIQDTQMLALDRNLHNRMVQPPQFLDIPSITNEPRTDRNSYREEMGTRTSIYDNLPSPYLCAKTPSSANTPTTRINNKDLLTPGHRNSASVICPEPIVIDCDNKSEYFRLVVRRTVRDCSDSDSSENETRDTSTHLNSLSRHFRGKKPKSKPKSKTKTNYSAEVNLSSEDELEGNDLTMAQTADYQPRLAVMQGLTPTGSRTATLENPKMKNIHHQRSPSGLSNGSVGLTLDNDDIQFEITNANRSSKRMNRFMQLSQASLQRKQKKPQRLETDDGGAAAEVKDRPPSSSLVRDFWDGTLRRLRRSGRSKALLRQGKVKSEIPSLSRQLSRSLSDVSKQEPTTPVAVIHQRSRSALAANEVYITSSHMYVTPTASNSTATSVTMQNSSEKTSMELHVDNLNNLSNEQSRVSTIQNCSHARLAVPSVEQHIKTSHRKRVRVASWSHGEDETNEYVEVSASSKKQSNKNSNLQIPKESQNGNTFYSPNTLRKCAHVHETIFNPTVTISHKNDGEVHHQEFTCNRTKTGSIPNSYGSAEQHHTPVNDVMLPVKLRLPGGQEQDILLTKQDIYGNSQKSRRRIKDVTLRRKRSMSQPNLDVRHLAR